MSHNDQNNEIVIKLKAEFADLLLKHSQQNDFITLQMEQYRKILIRIKDLITDKDVGVEELVAMVADLVNKAKSATTPKPRIAKTGEE